MTEFPESEVRRNKANGQKVLTVPKDSDIFEDEKVKLIGLGEHWDAIPGYLKTHHMLRELITLAIKSQSYIENDSELGEIVPHLEDAGDSLSAALDVIEENRVVYADVSTEELQESCEHEKISRKAGEKSGWQCVNCKKPIPLDL